MLKIINTVLLIIITILIGILAYRVLQSPPKVTVSARPDINQEIIKENAVEADDEKEVPTDRDDKAQLESIAHSAQESAAVDKEKVEAIVSDYIKNHPEIVVQAIQLFQKNKEQEAANKVQEYIKEKKADIELVGSNPILGNPNGEVVIVEFYDYKCGYCKQGNHVLKQILEKNNNVKIILRPFPILGDLSVYLAKVVLAVNKIDSTKFSIIHEAIMEMSHLTKEAVEKLLIDHNLDINMIHDKISSSEIQGVLDANFELAGNLRIQGAPAYLINGQLLPGLIDIEKLQQLIDEAVKDGIKK